MNLFVRPLAVALAGCALAAGTAAAADAAKAPVVGTPAATAAAGKGVPAASPSALAGAPRGYHIVNSGFLTAANGSQTQGFVTCPTGTVPFGGGAEVTSFSTAANINTSIPTSNGWRADVNNASGSDTTFEVYAVCAKAPRYYQVVESSPIANPAFGEATATAACPVGTKVLGGGAYSESGDTAVNLNTTIPQGNAWRVDMNNGSAFSTAYEVYAVCAHKPGGYTVLSGNSVAAAAGQQSSAHVSCPAPTVPLGGGIYSSSDSTLVNVNTSTPNTSINGWDAYESNGSPSDASITPWVICAGTL
jgi:hypothetical protein